MVTVFSPDWEHSPFILHLREGSPVLGVEVVERLLNPPLLHLSEALTSGGGQQPLGVPQLEAARSLLDLPQASSCRQKGQESKSRDGLTAGRRSLSWFLGGSASAAASS